MALPEESGLCPRGGTALAAAVRGLILTVSSSEYAQTPEYTMLATISISPIVLYYSMETCRNHTNAAGRAAEPA